MVSVIHTGMRTLWFHSSYPGVSPVSGFRKTKHRKTMYIDGHERADVVLDRKRYVEELATYSPYMCQYGGDDMVILTPPDKTDKGEVVLVVHDETVLHQHDGEDWSYQEVRPKFEYLCISARWWWFVGKGGGGGGGGGIRALATVAARVPSAAAVVAGRFSLTALPQPPPLLLQRTCKNPVLPPFTFLMLPTCVLLFWFPRRVGARV